MGVKLSDLIDGKKLDLDELNGKIIAVDAFNILYQFITTIRQPDGSPLTDSKGNNTSHLIGLFYRFTNLIKKNIKLIFVFDGASHELKKAEQERRSEIKTDAEQKYKEAEMIDDLESMKKYASRTARLTKEMIAESKQLLEGMGIPWIQAISDGEAQCAKIVKDGNAYAVMSQDADSMLFGAPRVIKNLSISQRKKKKGSLSSEKTMPEIITLNDVLLSLEITQEELIILGILVGTDFNPGGIKGIGPKKALKLVKDFKDHNKLFEEVGWDDNFDYDWKEVFDIFMNPKYNEDYTIEWNNFDKDKIMKILVEEHDFSKTRISEVCEEVLNSLNKEQKGLSDFF